MPEHKKPRCRHPTQGPDARTASSTFGEKIAKQRGVSLDAGLSWSHKGIRLLRSLHRHPEVAAIVRLITATFILGGQRAAHRKHPKWRIADWINDPACYERRQLLQFWMLFMQSGTPPHREPWDKATNRTRVMGK